MHNATVTGRLGNNVEVVQTKTGKTFAKGSLAVKIGWGENEETEWIDIIAWDPKVDWFSRATKGQLVTASGRFSIRRFEGRDGVQRAKMEITVTEVEFATTVAREDAGAAPQTEHKPKTTTRHVSNEETKGGWGGDANVDDDIPF